MFLDRTSTTSQISGQPPPIRLVLPATSANLGPGFDAVGLALALTLTIDAEGLGDIRKRYERLCVHGGTCMDGQY